MKRFIMALVIVLTTAPPGRAQENSYAPWRWPTPDKTAAAFALGAALGDLGTTAAGRGRGWHEATPWLRDSDGRPDLGKVAAIKIGSLGFAYFIHRKYPTAGRWAFWINFGVSGVATTINAVRLTRH